MFVTERTDIKPCYGRTFQEVVDLLINGQFDRLHNLPRAISKNPHAIKLLEQHPELVDVRFLSYNEAAGDLLYYHPDFSENQDIWFSRSPILDTLLLSPSLPELPVNYRFECSAVSKNPRAINYLLRNPKCIVLSDLCLNENAADLLEACHDIIDYWYLSRNTNPRAMSLLRRAIERGKAEQVNWKWLSANSCPDAVRLFLEYPEKIDFSCLSENECPLAFPIMQQNLDKMNWHWFCCNPLAVPLLPDYFEKINWTMLSERAKTKEQFQFLRRHFSRINWQGISLNGHPEATKLLEEHPDKIRWSLAIICHDLFETVTEYDYAGIRNARQALHAEFHAWAGHPSKMTTKWKDWGFVEEEIDSF